MKIIQFAHFSAPYKGGFIGSLEALKKNAGEGFYFIFCFPESTKYTPWINDFSKENKVYFTEDNVKESTKTLLEIFKLENPDIVHSHFDGYDLPLLEAKKAHKKLFEKDIKIIWHTRNKFSFHSNPLKRIYQELFFLYKYKIKSQSVYILSVSSGMKDFIEKRRGKVKKQFKIKVLPNGIITPLLSLPLKMDNPSTSEFIFGTFGGRNVDKRVDILIKAAQLLNKKKTEFKIRITKGVDTEEIVKTIFPNQIPTWLELIEQTNQIGDFYTKLNCFVSTSIHETFSNAIAEATLMKLPVIQSDIEGTHWNSSNPSTFVFKTLDPIDLAEKMEYVMNLEPEDLKMKCEQTKKNNEAEFGIDKWCRQVTKFYKQIIK